MLRHRFCLTAVMFTVLMTAAQAIDLTQFALPNKRFEGWARLQQDITPSAVTQIWRSPLSQVPKGVSGYQMVVYKLIISDSPVQASQQVTQLLQKEQFNDYVARGYRITADPWTVNGQKGMLFSVRGLAHAADDSSAQRAEIYTLAFARDESVVLLQVRQSCTAPQLNVADKAFARTGGKELADELGTYVISRWLTPPVAAEPIPVVPTAVETPPVVVTSVTPEPATPVAPAETVPATTTPETPMPPAVTETPRPAPQELANATRWATTDTFLSLLLPPGWKVSGTTPYLLTGPQDIKLRIYPWEKCETDGVRDRAFQDFIASNRDIALRGFVQETSSVPEAQGVAVRYVNYDRRTVYAVLLSSHERLWRIFVDYPAEDAPLPVSVQAMLNSLQLQ